MVDYKVRDLRKGPLTANPPLGPLQGGRIGKADRVNAILNNQDRAFGAGRRIIAAVGLHGCEQLMVLDADPNLNVLLYPTKDHEQIVAITRVRLTPGTMPSISLLALPSGSRQKLAGGEYKFDGAGGYVRVEFFWENQDTFDFETFSVFLHPKVSDHTYAAQPSGAGAGWDEVHALDLPLVCPPSFLNNAAKRRLYGENVELTTKVYFGESVRVLDLTVFEQPYLYARETGDAGTYSHHCHTTGAGAALGVYPFEYPVQRASEAASGDPTGGTLQALAVLDRQAKRSGPVLFTWSSWSDPDALVSDTEVSPVEFSATSDESLDGATAWDDALRGWSASSGGTARRHDTAGEYHVLRDVVGCVEVIVRVFGYVSGGDTGYLTIVASPDSRVEVEITSSGSAWASARGTLRCGIAADDVDASLLQVFGRVNAGTGTLYVRYITVEYCSIR